MKSNTVPLKVPMVSKLLTVLAIFCSASVWAAPKSLQKMSMGTKDGGGGTIIYPTKKQVLDAIKTIQINTQTGEDPEVTLEESVGSLLSYSDEIKDPVVKRILNDFGRFTDPEKTVPALRPLLRELNIQPVDGPCTDKHGENRAAAVKDFYFGKNFPKSLQALYDADETIYANICVSVSEFQKVPRANLRQNLIALLIHEISHVFGYDEVAAVHIQNFVLQQGRGYVNLEEEHIDYAIWGILQVEREVKRLGKMVMAKEVDYKVCSRIAKLTATMETFDNHLIDGYGIDEGRTRTISDQAMEKGDSLAPFITALNGYCGVRDAAYAGLSKYAAFGKIEYVNEGDRAGLLAGLKGLIAPIKTVQGLLKVTPKEYREYNAAVDYTEKALAEELQQ